VEVDAVSVVVVLLEWQQEVLRLLSHLQELRGLESLCLVSVGCDLVNRFLCLDLNLHELVKHQVAVGLDTVILDRGDVLSGPFVLHVAVHAHNSLICMPVVLSDLAAVGVANYPNNLALVLELVDVLL